MPLGQRAEGGRIGQELAEELDGHDLLALEFHGLDAGHTDVAEHLEVVQVVLGEGHPETGATDALEVLDEGFKLLVVHEEALLGPDAVREIVGHGPRKRIGFHPLAAFPVTALGGHFADVDFRVEVRSEGLPVIARVAVDDVEDVDPVAIRN